MLIATTDYIAKRVDGTTLTLNINIGAPELDPMSKHGDYRCKVEIPALSFFEYSYGIDAVQSLCLVVQCLKYALKPLMVEGCTFYLPEDLTHELDILSILSPTHRM
jgi:hypothetical protein